jgi:protein-tyrosine phosphatase
MTYALVFGSLSAYLAALAVLLRGPCWLLLWPALSFGLVGAAFAGLGPGVFGKRADGRLAGWAVALLLPYLALTWALWHLLRLTGREPCCHEVAPGVWVGRRAFARELPGGVSLVVDLTAEFPEPRAVTAGRGYLCLPTLDSAAPDPVGFAALLAKLKDHPGPVYIHCASGHGRSATVAGALLLARGRAAEPREAERLLRQVRPGIRLNKAQRALLRDYLDHQPKPEPHPAPS